MASTRCVLHLYEFHLLGSFLGSVSSMASSSESFGTSFVHVSLLTSSSEEIDVSIDEAIVALWIRYGSSFRSFSYFVTANCAASLSYWTGSWTISLRTERMEVMGPLKRPITSLGFTFLYRSIE